LTTNEYIDHASAEVDAKAVPAGTGTPFADAVLRLRRDERDGEQIVSFHALPWSQGRSLADCGGRIGEKYRQLFGDAFLETEVTYSGGVLDSFLRPTASLDMAQQLTADAFGASYTFFVTCGTTLANQVAFDALAGPRRRILVDRTAHQSVHVAAGQSAATVDYMPVAEHVQVAEQPVLDVPRMLRMVTDAAERGRPYDAIVLAGSSYDGVVYNMHPILAACLEASPTTAFLVDEAWAAINTFHPELRPLTALDAAERITADGTPITLLVTHSAHKSMSAARQGSYLHVVGDAELIARLASVLYGRHTTSPSIPILASLDLARAQAQSHGEPLVQRALDLAADLRRAIGSDPSLADYRIVPYPVCDIAHQRYFAADPTKVHIDVTELGLRGDEVRQRLIRDYGIYVSRTLQHGFLVNLHIGITADDVERLLGALRSLARREHGRLYARPDLVNDAAATVDRLLIAYPPGVPLAVPGEPWTDQLRQRVDASRRGGADIYTLPAGEPHCSHAHVCEEVS